GEGAQHVLHHRAAARADLGNDGWPWGAAGLPGRVEPYRNQLAEHLAYLRRGREVALGAEGIARRVVAMLRIEEAERHVIGHAHRTCGFDEAAYLLRKLAHVSWPAGAGLRAVSIAHNPAATIGRESTMPMVSHPPMR